jgi:hypothetical protein
MNLSQMNLTRPLRLVVVVTGLITLSTLASQAAQANDSYKTTASQYLWWCTADGYDHDNRLRSVSGPNRKTESEARTAAVQQCNSLGYMGCQSRSCFQTGTY